ncbi:MAG TPA: DMT family transporter, partial [Candidatus Binatus sp.]|nr:DMT family transporter [Candidatus Binatus sp.]
MPISHRSLIQTLVGASLWGLSGNAAQALFQFYNFPVLGLGTIRMLLSGAILMLILRPSKPSGQWRRLIQLSIVGYAGSQFFYLAAIQYSNAATATLLQFLFLPMVTGYEAATGWFRWSHRWTLTIVLALAGTVLLVVGTSFKVLITPVGFATGLLAAVSGAYYTLGSRDYVRQQGSWWITCWGFMIGGLVTLPLGIFALRDYPFPSNLNDLLILTSLVSIVIIFGTLLAFGL